MKTMMFALVPLRVSLTFLSLKSHDLIRSLPNGNLIVHFGGTMVGMNSVMTHGGVAPWLRVWLR